MEKIKQQRLITNIFGIVIFIFVLTAWVIGKHIGAVLAAIVGILAYLFFRKFDKKK